MASASLPVRKVAVLGAGVMGAQIAAHLANCDVPVLLSVGVCMVSLGATKWLFGEDTKLGNMPIWAPYVLFFFALVSWVFGVLMMLQVKNALDQQRAAQQPQA